MKSRALPYYRHIQLFGQDSAAMEESLLCIWTFLRHFGTADYPWTGRLMMADNKPRIMCFAFIPNFGLKYFKDTQFYVTHEGLLKLSEQTSTVNLHGIGRIFNFRYREIAGARLKPFFKGDYNCHSQEAKRSKSFFSSFFLDALDTKASRKRRVSEHVSNWTEPAHSVTIMITPGILNSIQNQCHGQVSRPFL